MMQRYKRAKRLHDKLSGVRVNRLGRLCLLGWFYGLLVWGYVVAMQVREPQSVYWQLAEWVPIRLDFFGEIGFAISLLCAMALALRGNA
jgi:hypothetical protein